MADPSPSATLRQLAEAATPGPWQAGVRYPESVTFEMADGVSRFHTRTASPEDAHLIALAPALALWAADAAEELQRHSSDQQLTGGYINWDAADELLARLGDLVAPPADDRGQEPTA